MSTATLLYLYIGFRVISEIFDTWLSAINRGYYLDSSRQEEAKKALGISDEDFAKTLAYTEDKYKFGKFSSWTNLLIFLIFLTIGGFGWVEKSAESLAQSWFGGGDIVTGLLFFGILTVLSTIVKIPFSFYHTFTIEERHGFNKTTIGRFIGDLIKGLLLTAVLGGGLLALLLWIMEVSGSYWWLLAWGVITLFSLLTMWIYPTLLAPLFNKFKPLEDSALKEQIDALAKRVGFNAGAISVMNASIRSSHGNAYFSGVFGKKNIVLFDTLIEAMSPSQVTAVLAHELGHFKLHHIRKRLIMSTVMTGIMLYALSLCLPLEVFYQAFYLKGVSFYGAFIVFGLWFSFIDFFIQPLMTYLSRKNEFEADAFALENIDDKLELSRALLKLRQKSHVMPLSHPWYSGYHHSHPPMLERLAAMGYKHKEA